MRRSILNFYLGNKELGLEDFTQIINLSPSWASYYNRATIYFHWFQDYQACIQDMDRAIERDPKKSISYYVRGNAHFELGDLEKAFADYELAQQLSESDPDPIGKTDEHGYFARGMAWFRLGNLEKALQDLEITLALSQDHYRTPEFLTQIHDWIAKIKGSMRIG
jgi:tetratricopeptide (TPR) repeat protein